MRLTIKIKNEIKKNIDTMFEKRFSNIELPNSFWLDLVESARQKIESQASSFSLPKQWLIQMNYAVFNLEVEELDNLKHTTIQSPADQIQWMNIPVSFKLIGLALYSYSNTFKITKELWPEVCKEIYIEHRQKHHDILQEQTAMLKSTAIIYNRCTTLKKLIEDWPEVNALLPEWVKLQIERENIKKVKPIHKPELNQEALDSLNISLLKNLMLTN